MSSQLDPVRRSVLHMLDAITQDGKLYSEVAPKLLSKLSGPERARAQRLCLETLRWADRADRALGPYVRMRPPETVLNALRLGTFEICQEGAAPYGVVDALVSIIGADTRTTRLSGMVNAVLRKVAKDAEKWPSLPEPRMPKWLRKPLLADFGKHTVAAIETSHAQAASIDLTVKKDAAEWAKRLDGQLLPTGSVRLPRGVELTKLQGYETGDWWVQDAAAAIPAKILNAQKGERVLDMCAAPGGKTMQLAATGASVVALDDSAKRLERVTENLARTKLSAEVVQADAREFEAPLFDAILLDAPCSATGTIRRHPDLQYAKDGSEFPSLFELQLAMIDAALRLLKPGGRLVYCTCSLLIDEGEEQIRDAIARHDGLSVDAKALGRTGIDPDWISETGIRTRPDYWPDLGGIDAFFISRLQKPA